MNTTYSRSAWSSAAARARPRASCLRIINVTMTILIIITPCNYNRLYHIILCYVISYYIILHLLEEAAERAGTAGRLIRVNARHPTLARRLRATQVRAYDGRA